MPKVEAAVVGFLACLVLAKFAPVLFAVAVAIALAGVGLAGVMLAIKHAEGDEPQYTSNYTGQVYSDAEDWEWWKSNTVAKPPQSSSVPNSPRETEASRRMSKGCGPFRPVPPCKNCKPKSKPKREPEPEPEPVRTKSRQEQRQETRREEPKRDGFWKPFAGQPTQREQPVYSQSKVDADFAAFQAAWAGKDPSKIRKAGARKFKGYARNVPHDVEVMTRINQWVDELKGKNQRRR